MKESVLPNFEKVSRKLQRRGLFLPINEVIDLNEQSDTCISQGYFNLRWLAIFVYCL